MPVAIVALPNGGGVPAIRNLPEPLDCTVLVHWIGAPADLLKVIVQGADVPRYLIIEGHGSDEGFYFGAYAPFIDTLILQGEYMPPAVVRQHINLPACTVIVLTCEGGIEPMARAFLAGGVGAYIGCRTGPNGVASYIFLANLFYSIRAKQLSDRDAWRRALVATDHPDIYEFSYYHTDGTEERFTS